MELPSLADLNFVCLLVAIRRGIYMLAGEQIQILLTQSNALVGQVDLRLDMATLDSRQGYQIDFPY